MWEFTSIISAKFLTVTILGKIIGNYWMHAQNQILQNDHVIGLQHFYRKVNSKLSHTSYIQSNKFIGSDRVMGVSHNWHCIIAMTWHLE